jgi:hypothetical protein
MKRRVLYIVQKRENGKTCALYNCFFSFHCMYIFISFAVFVLKSLFAIKKIYAMQISLVPRFCCILSPDFNVNNVFKYILCTSSVYYFTGDSESQFLKGHENCGIVSFKY